MLFLQWGWWSTKFKKLVNSFLRFGKSSFTVMMIPHSENNIFSFQISNFVILFFIGVFLLSGLSIFSYHKWKRTLSMELSAIRESDREYLEQSELANKLLSFQRLSLQSYAAGVNGMMKSMAPPLSSRFDLSREDEQEAVRSLVRRHQIHPLYLSDNLVELARIEKLLEKTTPSTQLLQNVFSARNFLLTAMPYRWPLQGGAGIKTSGFGERYSPFEGTRSKHTGVDIAAYPGTPILATAEGTVLFSGVQEGYGNSVIILHPLGYQTLYGHASRTFVYTGQYVKRGDRIALLGMSGRATGYHLHYEVRLQGSPVEPWAYLSTEF
jgi:murein DD-endopeptidase MepM/ murein hydrolase activator NlpD